MVNGKPARQACIDRDYGIVFQDPVLYDWRSVAKNIALPHELAGRAREARQRKVAEMLRLVELESFGDHYRWQLSGGMHQRVSIAEAVFLSARVVVMSPRPGRVADVIAIDLALPRNTATREDPRFFEHVTRVRQALHLGGEREQEPVA